MDADEKLMEIIREHGGKLVRSKKHAVYRFPDGRVFVRARSPSCPRSDANSLSDLRLFLGLNSPDRGAPGERRERRQKRGGARQPVPPQSTRSYIGKSFKQKLLEALRKEGR